MWIRGKCRQGINPSKSMNGVCTSVSSKCRKIIRGKCRQTISVELVWIEEITVKVVINASGLYKYAFTIVKQYVWVLNMQIPDLPH